jgi:hypothetical protein
LTLIWEVSTRRPNDVATRPDATQCSRIFLVSFTDVEMSDNEDRLDARPSRLDVDLLWEESRYSGKAITEDRLNEANFCPAANLSESEFELK